MKKHGDTKTPDLLGDRYDLAGERPRQPTRQAKWRERTGKKAITVNLPADLVDAFHAKRGTTSANDVIERLLRTQYLRKR